jgi:hypothetical protein
LEIKEHVLRMTIDVVLDEKVNQGSIYHPDIYFLVIYLGIKRIKQDTHNTCVWGIIKYKWALTHVYFG